MCVSANCRRPEWRSHKCENDEFDHWVECERAPLLATTSATSTDLASPRPVQHTSTRAVDVSFLLRQSVYLCVCPLIFIAPFVTACRSIYQCEHADSHAATASVVAFFSSMSPLIDLSLIWALKSTFSKYRCARAVAAKLSHFSDRLKRVLPVSWIASLCQSVFLINAQM